jgi:hypothetical protein
MCSGEIVPFQRNFTAFTFALITTLRKAPISDSFALVTGGLPCARASQGLWLEFGVWKGTTIEIMANFRRKHVSIRPAVYGFDSFLGLPEDWRHVWRPGHRAALRKAASMSRGNFALAGQPPKLPAHLESLVGWVVGWYNESLPRFLSKAHTEPALSTTFVLTSHSYDLCAGCATDFSHRMTRSQSLFFILIVICTPRPRPSLTCWQLGYTQVPYLSLTSYSITQSIKHTRFVRCGNSCGIITTTWKCSRRRHTTLASSHAQKTLSKAVR